MYTVQIIYVKILIIPYGNANCTVVNPLHEVIIIIHLCVLNDLSSSVSYNVIPKSYNIEINLLFK